MTGTPVITKMGCTESRKHVVVKYQMDMVQNKMFVIMLIGRLYLIGN